MIVGMGAAAFVVESAQAARERGLQPICEVLGAVTANSAFHGTRLDVDHIAQMMERVVAQAESRGVDRHEIAASTVFVSHETYTPARGGSAAAEINALRSTFGPQADSIVITNTKGFTGHAMGAGIEDVVAIKALETGIVPPVPNYKEPDPDARRAQPLAGRRLPGPPRPPARRRLRLPDRHVAAALDPAPGRSAPRSRASSGTPTGSPTRRPGSAGWTRCAGIPGARLEVVTRRLRVVDRRRRPRRPPTSAPTARDAPGRLDRNDPDALLRRRRRLPGSPLPSPPVPLSLPEPVARHRAAPCRSAASRPAAVR